LRRVVVTGLGLISAVGKDPDTVWGELRAGRCSGTRPCDRFDVSDLPTRIAATVRDFDADQVFGRRDSQDMDRVAHLSLYAACRAVEDAGLGASAAEPFASGVVFGTGIGGIGSTARTVEMAAAGQQRRILPSFIPMAMHNATAFHLARRFGFRGPNYTVSTACSSASLAIGTAFRMIQRGEANVILAGGGDAPVIASVFRAWCAMRVMSMRGGSPETTFRPFDRERDGFVLGEGAAIVVCEDAEHALERNARIYGELLGFANTCDAVKLTAPNAAVQAEAVRRALDDSGLDPDGIGFVVGHGTATRLNDMTEARVLREVFGPALNGVRVTSCKPYFGHTMGASGALEFVVGLLALERGEVPPIANLNETDPECDIPLVSGSAARWARPAFLAQSFGFGGNNVALVARKWQGDAYAQPNTWGSLA
jgi:3-oxoacyl-[acyl-carrier-protein] synthase II